MIISPPVSKLHRLEPAPNKASPGCSLRYGRYGCPQASFPFGGLDATIFLFFATGLANPSRNPAAKIGPQGIVLPMIGIKWINDARKFHLSFEKSDLDANLWGSSEIFC
ncbi:hypothetical protein [Novosphingobium kaempferiae]|uniref:hypothetical protein n=1 Tax=Novosphingobium kaempferiae TaxID=2896849 RepID=UPI001E2E0099|nr:hypothetical protein [Novosphingobium kaempferiae]